MTSIQEHLAGVAAGECSLESQPDDDFKFMTTSTVEAKEEPEAKDFGWIPPPPPNVATRITEEMPEVVDLETDYSGWSKDRLIFHLQLAKDSFRIERGRSNAKTVLVDGKDLCIANLRNNKRQLEISEGNATKELKRMRATVRKMTGQRTGLQDQLDLQLARIRDFKKDNDMTDHRLRHFISYKRTAIRRIRDLTAENKRLEERLGEKLESEESDSDDPDWVDPNYK